MKLFATMVVGASAGAIDANPSNFDESVYQFSGPVLVKFLAPWWGHCTRMKEAWNTAHDETDGVNFVDVDCTQHGSLCQDHGVRGYPTIKYWNAGEKTQGDAQDYRSGRDLVSLKEFAQGLLKSNDEL